MKCPKCGSDQVTVIDSRRDDSMVTRRRKCMDCNHRFQTHEITAEAYNEMKEKEKTLKFIIESVRRECIATVRKGLFE